jgi:hypothetical protein
MSWTHRDTENASATSGTTVTVTKPTGTVDGDLLYAVCYGIATGLPTWSAPAGWSSIDSVAQGTSTNTANFYKVASGEGASFVFTFSNAISQAVAIVSSFIPSAGAVLDAHSSANNASSTNFCAPGVTTATDHELLIYSGGDSASATITAPTGFTKPTNGEKAQNSVDVTTCYKLDAGTAGATGDVVGTGSAAIANRDFLVAFMAAAATSLVAPAQERRAAAATATPAAAVGGTDRPWERRRLAQIAALTNPPAAGAAASLVPPQQEHRAASTTATVLLPTAGPDRPWERRRRNPLAILTKPPTSLVPPAQERRAAATITATASRQDRPWDRVRRNPIAVLTKPPPATTPSLVPPAQERRAATTATASRQDRPWDRLRRSPVPVLTKPTGAGISTTAPAASGFPVSVLGQVSLFDPGWRNEQRVEVGALVASWTINGVGRLSCHLPANKVVRAGNPQGALLGRWLYWEHPTCGVWAGIVEDVPSDVDAATQEIGANAFAAILGTKRGPRTLDPTMRKPAGGLALMALRYAEKGPRSWFDAINVDNSGPEFSVSWRGDTVLQVWQQLQTASKQEWRCTTDRTRKTTLEWRLRVGSDLRNKVLIADGYQLAGGRVEQSIAGVVNDHLALSADAKFANRSAVVVEDKASILAYGRRQGPAVTYPGFVLRHALRTVAKFAVDQQAQPVYPTTVVLAADNGLGIRNVPLSVREGDWVRLFRGGLTSPLDFRVVSRSVDLSANQVTFVGDATIAETAWTRRQA